MKLVTSTVEVATTQAGYKFPTDHPVRVRDDEAKTKVYVIPVTYVDPEDADFDFTEDFTQACKEQGVKSVDEIVKACKSGIRLLLGKIAKDAYATEGGSGLKARDQAVGWIASQPALLATWASLHAQGKHEEAGAYAVEQWRAR